jgi:hypothetical protein
MILEDELHQDQGFGSWRMVCRLPGREYDLYPTKAGGRMANLRLLALNGPLGVSAQMVLI